MFYSPSNSRHKHPNHARNWYARNLQCYQCIGTCKICGEWCCRYNEARAKLEDPTKTPAEQQEIKEMMHQIELHGNPIGLDASTFLKCTTDGCKKLVCPECCSICPDEMCQDLQCIVGITYPLIKSDSLIT